MTILDRLVLYSCLGLLVFIVGLLVFIVSVPLREAIFFPRPQMVMREIKKQAAQTAKSIGEMLDDEDEKAVK